MFDPRRERLLIGTAQRYASRRYAIPLQKAELYARRADLLWDIPTSGYDDATCRM